MKTVTCIAPVNIAVIKYWGKRDEDLILPVNDSISGTLSTDDMCAKTTIMLSPTFLQDRFWLNHAEVSFDSPRLANCLAEVKKRSPKRDLLGHKLHICSENNFPTAAGLASSAAGYACLVHALATLYGVEGDVSDIARRGSGSACRSVLGGWVRWHRGSAPDGADSVASQVAPAAHWPQMRVLVLVVSDDRKKTASTAGMRLSVRTSTLLKHRVEAVVPRRADEMADAIRDRDFPKFGQLTMQDSNQFHAVCLDTYPPCFYMNDVSRAVIEMVHGYNEFRGSVKVAYTCDAGPNVCLYLLEDDVGEVLGLVDALFPRNTPDGTYFKGQKVDVRKSDLVEKLGLQRHGLGLLKYIICTKIGEGPKILTGDADHLMNEEGVPKAMVG